VRAAVWVVTAHAIPVLHRRVRVAILHAFGQVLVAEVAKTTRSFDQQGIQLAGVWQVTRRAFSVGEWRMVTAFSTHA
jgi:ABC-type thiamine transport system substrate-binding protein